MIYRERKKKYIIVATLIFFHETNKSSEVAWTDCLKTFAQSKEFAVPWNPSSTGADCCKRAMIHFVTALLAKHTGEKDKGRSMSVEQRTAAGPGTTRALINCTTWICTSNIDGAAGLS